MSLRTKLMTAIGIFVGLSAVMMAFTFLYVADIRPTDVETSGASAAKGRAVLDRSSQAHGRPAFVTHEAVRLRGSDEWIGIMGGMSDPYPLSEQGFRLDVETRRTNARMQLEGGPDAGHTWMVREDRQTLFSVAGEKLAPRSPRDLSVMIPADFVLPTYRYFALVAFEIPSAEIVGYVGERVWNGRPHDVIYATWHQAEAHAGADQYLVYVDKETSTISRMEFTLREMFPSALGAAVYSEYMEVDGVKLPKQVDIMGVFPGGAETLLHTLHFEEARFDPTDRMAFAP